MTLPLSETLKYYFFCHLYPRGPNPHDTALCSDQLIEPLQHYEVHFESYPSQQNQAIVQRAGVEIVKEGCDQNFGSNPHRCLASQAQARGRQILHVSQLVGHTLLFGPSHTICPVNTLFSACAHTQSGPERLLGQVLIKSTSHVIL